MHFHLDVKGNDLTVSYKPPQDFPKVDRITRDYSRGGFKRIFSINETIENSAISAKYINGILQVSLTVIPGKETSQREIHVN